MDQTQGSDMERLWALLSELSAQLSHNRQQTEELHRRADELKVRAGSLAVQSTVQCLSTRLDWCADSATTFPPQAQAVHAQTGFTLRRFNLDVSQGAAPSSLSQSAHTRLMPAIYRRGIRVGTRAAQCPARDGESGASAGEPATLESAQRL